MSNIKTHVTRRAAGIYQQPEFLILHALQNFGGLDVDSIPAVKLTNSTPIAEIGLTLRNMLAAYRNNKYRSDWKTTVTQFLKATGYRSWRSLARNAKSCWIEEIGEQIKFTPLRNGGFAGPTKGFQPFGAAEIHISITASDDELGGALLAALSQAL